MSKINSNEEWTTGAQGLVMGFEEFKELADEFYKHLMEVSHSRMDQQERQEQMKQVNKVIDNP